jgi:hypothetical protein
MGSRIDFWTGFLTVLPLLVLILGSIVIAISLSFLQGSARHAGLLTGCAIYLVGLVVAWVIKKSRKAQ